MDNVGYCTYLSWDVACGFCKCEREQYECERGYWQNTQWLVSPLTLIVTVTILFGVRSVAPASLLALHSVYFLKFLLCVIKRLKAAHTNSKKRINNVLFSFKTILPLLKKFPTHPDSSACSLVRSAPHWIVYKRYKIA